MSEHTHSPGPWSWIHLTGGGMTLADVNGGSVLIVRDGLLPMLEDQAVIAGAPDMLDALRDCLRALTDETGNVEEREYNAALKAREVIAKAQGGTP